LGRRDAADRVYPGFAFIKSSFAYAEGRLLKLSAEAGCFILYLAQHILRLIALSDFGC
jgi:hypothetical protein